MKRTGVLLGFLLVAAFAAKAQGTQATGGILSSPAASVVAVNSTNAIVSPYLQAAIASARPAGLHTSINGPGPQGVHSVFREIDLQIYAGYTYLRFYEVPGTTLATNGVVVGATYFANEWFGLEGEVDGGTGTKIGTQGSSFAFGGGGIRLASSRTFLRAQPWVHGLAGGAHQGPRTPSGSQGAFGYEAGGGLDFSVRNEHFGYRVEVDALGTSFFHTYQLSPKAAVEVLYRF